MAYFDQWAVRPVGVSRWGHCYHLPSKEEAEGLAKQLEELEAERDEAQAALTTIHRWIKRNHPDGFIDSMNYVQNLELVSDNWYDRFVRIERERDEAREIIRMAKNKFCENGSDGNIASEIFSILSGGK
jgi:hypothetical protein